MCQTKVSAMIVKSKEGSGGRLMSVCPACNKNSIILETDAQTIAIIVKKMGMTQKDKTKDKDMTIYTYS